LARVTHKILFSEDKFLYSKHPSKRKTKETAGFSKNPQGMEKGNEETQGRRRNTQKSYPQVFRSKVHKTAETRRAGAAVCTLLTRR